MSVGKLVLPDAVGGRNHHHRRLGLAGMANTGLVVEHRFVGVRFVGEIVERRCCDRRLQYAAQFRRERVHRGDIAAVAVDQQDLLEALRAELLVAKAEGTLAALESFKKSFPHFEMVTDELAFARAQIFKRALEQGLERLSEDESLRQSLRDIYARLESEGPVVLFQFKELPSESHERVDVSVRSSTYYVGRVNVPSQYFQGDYLRGRELQLGKELMPKFSELGTDELLQLQLKTSEQVLSDEEEKLPRIVIEHSTDFGDKYENKFPPGVFVGLAINFRVLIYPSSGEASYTYRTSFWIPPNFTDYRENKWSVPELYEQMTLRSRTGFLQRFAKAAWAPVEEMPAEAEAVKAPASVIDAQTAEVPVTQE